MNDKNDLLLTEAMELISRAEGMVALLYADERRGEAWRLAPHVGRQAMPAQPWTSSSQPLRTRPGREHPQTGLGQVAVTQSTRARYGRAATPTSR